MGKENVIQVGKKARQFALKDQHNQNFKLSDFKGKKILLSFHPLAWTKICATQMKTLEESKRTFDRENTVAVGISVDSTPCKIAWARSLRIRNTRLLSDFWPHGKVAKSFGILRSIEGISERANIVIDEKGTVIFVKVYPIHEVPDIAEITSVLKNG
jgi:peroxiredoxin